MNGNEARLSNQSGNRVAKGGKREVLYSSYEQPGQRASKVSGISAQGKASTKSGAALAGQIESGYTGSFNGKRKPNMMTSFLPGSREQ